METVQCLGVAADNVDILHWEDQPGMPGYALFAANALWKGSASVEQVITKAPVAALKPRTLVLIANVRSLDRSGIAPGAAEKLADILRWG